MDADLLGLDLLGAAPPVAQSPTSDGTWSTKRVILIRHGRSTWNDMLHQGEGATAAKAQAQAQLDALGGDFAEARSASSTAPSGATAGACAGGNGSGSSSKLTRGLRGFIKHTVAAGAKGAGAVAAAAGSSNGGYGGSSAAPNGGATGTGSEGLDAFSCDQGTLGREAPSGHTGRGQRAAAGLVQAVRGGVRHVAKFADKLQQVDHPLSTAGFQQARTLRRRVSAISNASGPATGAPASPLGERAGAAQSALLECQQWIVSPYLRALQTAAFVLAPLIRRDASLRISISPEANEIVTSQMSMDCQGKKGNVGHRVIARAIGRIAEQYEDEEDDFENAAIVAERQAELADVTAALCVMDLSEVSRVWWKDVVLFKKEHLKLEDIRIKRLMATLLRRPGTSVGMVAHSLLFQRLLQLYWPRDVGRQERLRCSLRNGASAETRDPYNDKIMNCGVVVLTLRFRGDLLGEEGAAPGDAAEIVCGEFLFDGHMEGALGREHQSIELLEGSPVPEGALARDHQPSDVLDTVALCEVKSDALLDPF
eukprot:TRINITY_DN22827_c0_g1_i2.p1 TRINITY_DN22827_c0_g1~~TRINITY_DN22827_c0_g1_i2.p1  ORF type:complete len:539 (-),score=103.14 TRINITY_DN22827_c0_g1_i2:65-1681(-)